MSYFRGHGVGPAPRRRYNLGLVPLAPEQKLDIQAIGIANLVRKGRADGIAQWCEIAYWTQDQKLTERVERLLNT
jgi:hypothetical protein